MRADEGRIDWDENGANCRPNNYLTYSGIGGFGWLWSVLRGIFRAVLRLQQITDYGEVESGRYA